MRCGKRLAAPLHDIIGQMPEQHDKSSDKDTAKGSKLQTLHRFSAKKHLTLHLMAGNCLPGNAIVNI